MTTCSIAGCDEIVKARGMVQVTLVVKLHGPADKYNCVDCGEQAEQWSYNNEDAEEKKNEKGHSYSTDVKYYEPRCIPCHREFDLACSIEEK